MDIKRCKGMLSAATKRSTSTSVVFTQMTRLLYFLLLLPVVLPAQIAPAASAVLDKDAVHEIRLTFKQANWYDLLTTDYDQYPDNTPYREASLVWGQYKFDTVGVRFKGNSSYRGATTKKKPFRIKLNEFVKGQKIDSMASFGLSNGWSDPSFVREKPYYEMAAALGMPASRSNFAALYINDEYWGLYILGEIVNGDFLTNHFGKGNDGGNLYKASDPGANLAYAGEDPTAYQALFSKESNETANDWTDLIELARVFDQTPIADLPARLDSLIDVDSFLTALALDNMTVNLDSYVGMAQNYYLYRRPSDQKWVWIVWDPSLAFGALAQGLSVQQMKNLALEWVQSTATGAGGGGGIGGRATTRPIASKLWQVPAYQQRYRTIYRGVVDKVMVPSQVVSRMNALRDLIRPWVQKDTQKLVTIEQFEAAMTADATSGAAGPGGAPGGGGLGGAPGLQPFIEGRVASIKALLDSQIPLTISATPASLFVAQTAAASSPASQNVALAFSDAAKSATFTATSSASWITAGTPSGTLPATLRISAAAAGLGAGTYSGAVAIAVSGATNSPLSIPVTMAVTSTPSLVANPASLTLTSFGGGGPGGPGAANNTQSIYVASTAGASPFTVTINDTTCGNFLSVSPTSGTTPATLTVTASPSTNASACTGKVNVASTGLASATIPVSLTVPTGPGGQPQSGITALVSSASYASGPVSPGNIVTIFGTNIGPASLASGTFTGGQLATTAGGVQVTFDGTPAPVLYARSNQVGVIVPFEVAGKTQTSVQLTVDGRPAPPIQQPVSPTSPGIYTTASTGTGQASVINQTGAVNAANAPAAKGSVVAIYITGAGQLTPTSKTGALGAATQSIAALVTVTIGGQQATVQYAGAAPGSVQGLYQINAIVPENAPTGSVALQLTAGGASAQTAVTMYVQ